MSFLINATDLKQKLEQSPPPIHLIDVRFNLKKPSWGAEAYRQAHLPHAIYMDLDNDLSSPVQEHGGRHPLPKVEDFVPKLGQAGISRDSQVVIYDQNNGMFAGRLWWMLRYYGMMQVQVLDGGLEAWQAAGYPLSSESVEPQPVVFEAALQEQMLVDIETVEASIDKAATMIVDARAPQRYRGEVEPMDAKAGHIPSAINKPFADNLSNNHYKNVDELQAIYSDIADAEEVIVYCGSGVTACHNILAMCQAGIDAAKLKLYAGSWSDWSSYQDKAIAVD